MCHASPSSGRATGNLYLIVRGGAHTSIAESAGLARLLAGLPHDAALQSDLSASGVNPAVLEPAREDPPGVPEWLRAEELLEEVAVCPGERLFAQTLASASAWRAAGEIAIAAGVLETIVRSRKHLGADVHEGSLLRACASLAGAASALPAARQVRLAIE